jgi:hypothetical protein
MMIVRSSKQQQQPQQPRRRKKRTTAGSIMVPCTIMMGALVVYFVVSGWLLPTYTHQKFVSSGSGTMLRAKYDDNDVDKPRTTHNNANLVMEVDTTSSHCFFREYERVEGVPVVGEVFASADKAFVHLVVESHAGCQSNNTFQFIPSTVFDCIFEQDGSVTHSLTVTSMDKVRDLTKSTAIETTSVIRRSRFHRFAYTITCPIPPHLQESIPKAGSAVTTAHLTLQMASSSTRGKIGEYKSSQPPLKKQQPQIQHLPICSHQWPQSRAATTAAATTSRTSLDTSNQEKKMYHVALMTRIALSYKDNQNPSTREKLSITHAEYLHWMEYHIAIGIEHFYIYQDNRDAVENDDLQQWCQPYIDKGLVTLIQYPYQDLVCNATEDIHEQLHHRTVRMGQLVGLNAGLRRYQEETEWLAHWDVDEYLYLRDDENDGKEDPILSTRKAMTKLLQLAKDIDDADEIEFQRPFYGPCKNSAANNEELHSLLPFQQKLCMTDQKDFGKVILRTATVGRAFFHYALEAIPSNRTIRTKPVEMLQGHLAHFRKGNYGEENVFDIPSNVFDAWEPHMQQKMVEHHIISQATVDALSTDVAVEPVVDEIIKLPQVLAIYFPQYHEDPLNNKLWVDGFTDWVSLNNSYSRNRLGYRIPRPTSDLGFYDLTETRPRQRQGELARQYNVDGFLYHVYWFYDRTHPGPTLAAPVEAMLRDGHPNLPFCFNWCETSWVNTWMGNDVFQKDQDGNVIEGGGDMMLQEQFFNATDQEIQEHYNWFKPFFHHENYIRLANQPVLFVYKHEDEAAPVLAKLRQLAIDDGFAGLHLVIGRKAPPANIFEPAEELKPRLQRKLETDVETLEQVGLDAAHASSSVYNQSMTYPYPLPYVTESYTVPHWCVHRKHNQAKASEAYDVTGLLTTFDNTPRRDPEQARIYGYGSKEKVLARFQRNLMATLFYQTCCMKYDPDFDSRFVTINAWNEWGEGMALEPSNVYDHGFLEIIRDVKHDVVAMQCNGGMLPADLVGATESELMERKKRNKLLLDASDAELAQTEATMARRLERSSSSSMSFSFSMDLSVPPTSMSSRSVNSNTTNGLQHPNR